MLTSKLPGDMVTPIAPKKPCKREHVPRTLGGGRAPQVSGRWMDCGLWQADTQQLSKRPDTCAAINAGTDQSLGELRMRPGPGAGGRAGLVAYRSLFLLLATQVETTSVPRREILPLRQVRNIKQGKATRAQPSPDLFLSPLPFTPPVINTTCPFPSRLCW